MKWVGVISLRLVKLTSIINGIEKINKNPLKEGKIMSIKAWITSKKHLRMRREIELWKSARKSGSQGGLRQNHEKVLGRLWIRIQPFQPPVQSYELVGKVSSVLREEKTSSRRLHRDVIAQEKGLFSIFDMRLFFPIFELRLETEIGGWEDNGVSNFESVAPLFRSLFHYI